MFSHPRHQTIMERHKLIMDKLTRDAGRRTLPPMSSVISLVESSSSAAALSSKGRKVRKARPRPAAKTLLKDASATLSPSRDGSKGGGSGTWTSWRDQTWRNPPANIKSLVQEGSASLGRSCATSWGNTGDWGSVWWLPDVQDPDAAMVPLGKQTAVEEVGHGELPHLIFIPFKMPPDGGWPLVVFLHGSGESAGTTSLERVAIQGPPQHAGRDPESLNCAVLSPQKPATSKWYDDDIQAAVVALVDRYVVSHKIDAARVYLTGLSAGGCGCWGLGASPKYATRWAAIAPVCGGLRNRGLRRGAQALADTPIWCFHGANDATLPVSLSDTTVDACQRTPRSVGDVKYTRLDKAPHRDYAWHAAGINDMSGHASWVYAYYPPDRPAGDVPLYDWFFAHTRPQDAAPKPTETHRQSLARLAGSCVFDTDRVASV